MNKQIQGAVIFLTLSLIATSCIGTTNQADIHVYVDQPTVKLSPLLYGLFYEDIRTHPKTSIIKWMRAD